MLAGPAPAEIQSDQAISPEALAGPASERQSFEDPADNSLLPRAGSFDQRSTSVLELLAGLTGFTSSFRTSLLSDISSAAHEGDQT